MMHNNVQKYAYSNNEILRYNKNMIGDYDLKPFKY